MLLDECVNFFCFTLLSDVLKDNIVLHFFIYLQSVRFHARSWLPARSIVAECLATRGNADPSGEILILDRFCPVSAKWFKDFAVFAASLDLLISSC